MLSANLPPESTRMRRRRAQTWMQMRLRLSQGRARGATEAHERGTNGPLTRATGADVFPLNLLMRQSLGRVGSAHVLPVVRQAGECLMVECLRLCMFSRKEHELTQDHSVTVIVILSWEAADRTRIAFSKRLAEDTRGNARATKLNLLITKLIK